MNKVETLLDEMAQHFIEKSKTLKSKASVIFIIAVDNKIHLMSSSNDTVRILRKALEISLEPPDEVFSERNKF